MKKNNLVYDLNDKPPVAKWIVFALQHVLAMFGATILVPILVNQGAGEEVLTIPVALMASGIGTLIYILCTKGKSPVYLGSSFAFISPMICAFVASKGGIGAVASGIMAVGLVYIIVAIIIKFCGKKWINKLLPPVVVGPMIIIIGLSLASSAVGNIGINAENPEVKNIIIAVVAFLVTAFTALKGKKMFKLIPFFVGIFISYLVAICLGIVDFSMVKEATFFSLPKIILPFKDYSINLIGILTIAPVAFVTIAEHIGDHKVLSTIINKDLIEDPGLDRTLLGDGIATFVAGLIGGPANTTYGENTAVVGMTKNASIWVIGLAAIFAICFGFLGKVCAIVSSIPTAILGGVSILLYGFIAVNGLKVLIDNKVDFYKTKNVIVASTMLVLGLGGAIISFTSGNGSVNISGMALAAILGIILNLILPKETV